MTHPTPTRPTPAPPVPDRPPRDLTVNKVLAGAGAAATSAVLGSFFGTAGTIAGAALGSVASTVATSVYQRSLDRTRDTLVARIRPVPDEPPVTPGDEDTVRLRVEPVVPPRSRPRWVAWTGATVLVFVLGLLAVTGVEWAKGSTLNSGDPGTSVGRVIGAGPGPVSDPAPADPSSSPSVEPTTDAAPTQATETPSATPDPSVTSSPDRATATPEATASPAPTAAATG